jgi:putative hemin transport protein
MPQLAHRIEPDQIVRDAFAHARLSSGARHRDIAQQLGLSEGELVAAHQHAPADGLVAQRLRPRWPAILARLEACGEVMALTRNASCVHEKTGVYRDCSVSGPAGREVGLVLGGAIDLRVFYRHWAHGFAVSEPRARDVQRSLQFFDAAGTALHKVFVRPATDLGAWAALVEAFADGAAPLRPVPAPAADGERPDAAVDVAALRDGWASLRDTHDFFGLLRRHGVSRTQALRLAEPRFARPVDPASAQQLLSGAAGLGTPVMVFVGNPGMIQIHSGPVQRVEVRGPWLNVLDPGFNLHLREDHVAAAWVVRKPTIDGLVTSLELFDAGGETIAMLFGERKPGRAELCAWRELVDGLVGDQSLQADAPCLH